MKRKMGRHSVVLLLVVVVTLFSKQVYSQLINGTGSYFGRTGFDRGMQATLYCGNWPESWIRGSAFLDKQSGVLRTVIDLETDATHAGPRGYLQVLILDRYGNILTRIATSEVARGGKTPGVADRTIVQSTSYIAPYLANQAERVIVVPICTGYLDRFWNISLQQIFDAWGNIQQFFTYFF